MTTTSVPTGRDLTTRRLPTWAPAAVAGGAVAVSVAIVYGLADGGPVIATVFAALLFVVALTVLATVVEGGRAARNRVAATFVYGAFVLALAPLVSVAW